VLAEFSGFRDSLPFQNQLRKSSGIFFGKKLYFYRNNPPRNVTVHKTHGIFSRSNQLPRRVFLQQLFDFLKVSPGKNMMIGVIQMAPPRYNAFVRIDADGSASAIPVTSKTGDFLQNCCEELWSNSGSP